MTARWASRSSFRTPKSKLLASVSLSTTERMKSMRITRIAFAFGILAGLTGCDDGYDLSRYESLRNDGELEDVVHEWMHDYVETYCQVRRDGRIACE